MTESDHISSSVARDVLMEEWKEGTASLLEAASQLQQLTRVVNILEGTDDASTTCYNQLKELEGLVSRLEDKVSNLHEILVDERRALDELDDLAVRAKQRRAKIETILKSLPSVLENEVQDRSSHQATPKDALGRKAEAARAVIGHHGLETIPEQYTHNFISLSRVSETEYLAIPRTIRGRIQLALINDALCDIENVGRMKSLSIARIKRKKQLLTWDKGSDEEYDLLCLSEQELRQSCAFFCYGESTARAVLLILRALERIKQIPSKRGDAFYFLP